jgi:hypothetical protein
LRSLHLKQDCGEYLIFEASQPAEEVGDLSLQADETVQDRNLVLQLGGRRLVLKDGEEVWVELIGQEGEGTGDAHVVWVVCRAEGIVDGVTQDLFSLQEGCKRGEDQQGLGTDLQRFGCGGEVGLEP